MTPSPALFQAVVGGVRPEISAEPHLSRIHTLRVGIPLWRFSRRREVVREGRSSVLDVAVVRLFRVDNVRSGLATEDLEREVLLESVGTRPVSWWASFGLGVGFGLTEQIAFDISGPPSVRQRKLSTLVSQFTGRRR